MSDFFFISYSAVDANDFALELADELAAGPPSIPVWLDKRALRAGEDWDEQLVEAIRTCKGMIFVMSPDSVRPDSVCKNEWVRALKYKKQVIPLLLDRDAELPFRLGSREYINFVGSREGATARLRRHLAWLDSKEGQLQALNYRLADAQRELPRAEPDRQPRIREDIAELERQIAQQQKVIDNPKAAEEQMQKSIEAVLEGERKPAKPIGGTAHGKFINPPPLIAPTWFQDRHFETQQIGEFLKDESLRLMTVLGRGGVGKTAMVCRLLRSLESGALPNDGGPFTVDGIVYLSAARSFHRPNLPDLYAGLAELLPDDTTKQLDSVYKNPQTTTRALMELLLQAFPRGRTVVVLLDNFEDLIAVETGKIKDAELDEALRAVLEFPPHALKFIVTTRVAPSEVALVQPGLQRRLDVDTGLDHPFAENILRVMDADGKVGLRDAPPALLGKARERTLGYPRALEHLFGILSADRSTTLEEILDDTRHLLPERVVAVLVGEAFSRLDSIAQRVMQALATYRYPVPAAAVDYLLQPYVPGIDSAGVLSRMVNMQFARRDAGRYYLHQVDRDYSLSRIDEGDPADREGEVATLTRFALRHRAAEWFRLSRKPREAWKTLGDLAAQLSEFDLRCEGEDYDTAAALLREFAFDYLLLWGHYRLTTELHNRIDGKIVDPWLACATAITLGTAYYRMGNLQKAKSVYERGLQLARDQKDRGSEGAFLGNLGIVYSDLGQCALAIEYIGQALPIRREGGYRTGEAIDLGNLALVYSEVGQNRQAVEYHQQALFIDREIENQSGEAEDLANLATCYLDLGRPDDAQRCLTDALALARQIGYRLIEAAAHEEIGELRVFHSKWDEAAKELETAIEIADDIGEPKNSKTAREVLALVNVYRNQLSVAREFANAARNYDIPLFNNRSSAIVGLVSLRQGDVTTATAAFTAAIAEADQLIASTPERFSALDVKGLALCGLVLCGNEAQIPDAITAYKAARAVTTDPGIVQMVLQMFDALAQADTVGILGPVRSAAAGEQQAYEASSI